METFNCEGLGIALVTPFLEDFSIDLKALENIIDKVIAGGADYIVALGTTAETPTLSGEEKLILTDFIRNMVAGRLPLVIGIGGNNTSAICNILETRDLSGYSAILSVTPFYNKPTQEGLYSHYLKLANSSPLPIILYNVPGRTGVNLSAKTTLRLASDCHKIIGIKEASGKMEQIKEIIEKAPDGFKVISGNDSDTFDIMKTGGKGVISVLGNVCPEKMKTLVELCQNENYDKAGSCQNQLKEIIGLLFEEGNPAGVKAALANSGIVKNVLRLPLVKASPRLEAKIKKAIASI